MYRKLSAVFLTIFLLFITGNAQKADVAVSLNEPLFDALLDAMFQNFDPPEFSIAQNNIYHRDAETQSLRNRGISRSANSFLASSASQRLSGKKPLCGETIKILREINGVRTAVRFRDGKIFVPLAFSGSYAPPFVGCVEFSGWAESNIDLEFDKDAQRLIGRVRVLNVNLTGAGGVGGSLIAKMLQGSIDKRLNPIEILTLDKLSFAFPVSKSGNLKMKATAVRNEIVNGALNVVVTFQFLKS